jgi:hypothetical protein
VVARAHLDAGGVLCDLTLDNTGDADAALPGGVTVGWAGAAGEAGDGLSGYGLTLDGTAAAFRLRGGGSGGIVRPGQSLALGWLRFSKPVSAASLTFAIE